MPTEMREGECRKTSRGVTYCYISGVGVRFCPAGTETERECKEGIRATGDRRRGRWQRRRVGVELPAYMPKRRRHSSPEVEV